MLNHSGRLCFRVVLFVAVAIVTSAASGASDFPSGSYTSGPYILEFNRNGTFKVLKSGYALVEGEYSVTGQQIELNDKSGPFACSGPGKARGTYNWKLENGNLMLSKVQDDCADRSESFAGSAWKQQ